MEIDPATICARTSAGETELAQPRSGLTLPQRKALSLLAAPRAYSEFAAENHLDPDRLARDFMRLAELGLITLQLDSINVVPRAPARAESAPARVSGISRPRKAARAADPQLQPVVIGAAPGRTPLRMAVFAGAAVIALTAGWLTLRDGPQTTPRASAAPQPAPFPPQPLPASTAASAPALPQAPAPSTAASASPAAPVPAKTAAVRVAASERQSAARDARPATGIVPAARPDPSVAQSSLRPLSVPAPTSEPAADRTPERAPQRIPEGTPDPPAPPAVASAPPASVPAAAPVLVASAAKPPMIATPLPKPSLRPIVSEAPEFPKEAVAEGVTSGNVKARVTVDATGKVAGIDIVDAQPRRIFDRAVRSALWHWQFEPGAPNRTAEVEIAFTR